MSADGGADAYYDYDAVDRLIQVTLSDNLTQNQIRRFAYDGLGHMAWAENPENGTMAYNSYDALGNLLSVQDSRGNVLRSVYDFAGRLKEQWLTPSGSTEPFQPAVHEMGVEETPGTRAIRAEQVGEHVVER